MQHDPDQTLILRTLAGEANAFGQLVQRHQTAVFNVCWRMLGTREEAEDLVQEAFIRAYERLHTFDLTRPFGPWMRTVAANLCLNKLQRPPPTLLPLEQVDEQVATTAATTPEALAVQQEAAAAMQQAISTLPPLYRAVIELRHFQELRYDEIAVQLGISPAAVKTNLFRARKQLAQLLTPLAGGHE